jgi:hypothetical protein
MRIDDLTNLHIEDAVIAQETPFRRVGMGEKYWEAKIDCAFAMHRSSYKDRMGYWGVEDGPLGPFGPSLYTKPPYQMRHLSWYVTPDTLTEEWRYALKHASDRGVIWTQILRKWFHETNVPL